MRIIPKFNPYTMPDDLILALNTGRTRELAFVLEAIHDNAKGGKASQHLLLHGPRGNGKSFFLRLMQIHLKDLENLECFLFPEEQNNFYQPSDLIKGLRQFIQSGERTEGIAGWASGGREEWDKQIRELEAVRESRPNTHFVIGIENFDMLFGSGGAFESRKDQFLLREFLTTTPWLTLAATTLHPDLDAQYEKALFHSFAKLELTPWEDREHQSYLKRRMCVDDLKATPMSQAQLKTLTRFTGGIPRITVIMSDVLSQDQLESTTRTLENTIDILTPFYQDLLSRIPTKSRLLFDALIRGGEPCSQSELAARVGTSQNVIARSFKWLLAHQYLTVDIPVGEKQRLYSVRDRLFAHYYQMRHIHAQSDKSILAIMSEFLTSFYNSRQLRRHAEVFLERGQPDKSRDLLQISLKGAGIDADVLSWKDNIQSLIQALDLKDTKEIKPPETFEEAKEQLLAARDMLAACTHGPKTLDKEEFSRLLFGSPSFSITERIRMACRCINNELGVQEWEKMLNGFKEEKKEVSKALGKSFDLLADAMIECKIILDFMSNARLNRIKCESPLFYLGIIEGRGIYLGKVGRYEEALSLHKKALKFRNKEKNKSGQAWNMGQIGWNLEKLDRHKDALKSHEKSLKLWILEGDIYGQAWNLGQIGFNFKMMGQYNNSLKSYEKSLSLWLIENKVYWQAWCMFYIGWDFEHLSRYEEAIKSYTNSLEIWTMEDNKSEQAIILGRIGCNLEKLYRYEESLDHHNKALKIWSHEKNISEQAWNLGRIGHIFELLHRYEEALNSHKKALELRIQEKNIPEQAWNLGQIGWNLECLNRHEEALQFHKKSMELWMKNENKSMQAWNLGKIGWNLKKLMFHEEAINSHKKALSLWIQEGDISGQAWNLGRIGWSLLALNRPEEALGYHEKALKFRIEEGDIIEQLWNLGQMAVNLILVHKKSEAWKIIDKYNNRIKESRYYMIRQLGVAVGYYEKKNELAEAFSTGVDIIKEIRSREEVFSPSLPMPAFLAGLLEANVKIELVEDLANHILEECGEEMRSHLEGIIGVIEYIKSGKSRNLLIKMPPEKRKAVEALVEELDL